jgi:hypothetical protein
VDPDPTGGLDPEPPHRTIWLRDADGPWRELAGQEGWAGMSLAIDGSTVVVGIRDASLASAYRLLVSDDAGTTWVDVATPVDLPAGACGIALHASDLILRCVAEEEDVAVAYLHTDLGLLASATPTP